MNPSEIKTLRISYYVGLIGTVVICLGVLIIPPPKFNDRPYFLGAGGLLIGYFFLSTFADLINVSSTEITEKPKLSIGKKLCGYLCLYNGWIIVIAAGLSILIGIPLTLSEGPLEIGYTALVGLFSGLMLVYGWALIHYVSEAFKILNPKSSKKFASSSPEMQEVERKARLYDQYNSKNQ